MYYSVYAGLGFAALFGLLGPLGTRRVTPAAATWLLSVGSVISAISAAIALGVLGMTLIGQDPSVAGAEHWSVPAFRHADPVRWPVALAALGLLIIAAVRVARLGYHRTQSLLAARRLNRAVADTGSDLVVLPDLTPDAYAVPGHPGRIFVTRGMLTLLSREECDVMLAHERSHLRHRHHWHRTVVTLASALNPLLAPVPPMQVWLTERWADEDAARTQSRETVAAALRRAAAATDATWHRPQGALALAAHPVENRIAALLEAPPRRHPMVLAIVAAILTLSVCGTWDGVTDEAQLFHSVTAIAPAGHIAPATAFSRSG